MIILAKLVQSCVAISNNLVLYYVIFLILKCPTELYWFILVMFHSTPVVNQFMKVGTTQTDSLLDLLCYFNS